MSRVRQWFGRQAMRLSGASRLEPRLAEISERLGHSDTVDVDALRQRQSQRYLSLAVLRDRYPDILDPAKVDLSAFELSVFSQNGEDGVLMEILHRIGIEARWFVEFGAGDGTENCCCLLADVLGWSGLFAELDATAFARLSSKYRNNDRVTTLNHAITPENVNDIFERAGVPKELDVLSIDVDGSDFWIWQAIDRFNPRVVVIEHNSSLDATQPLVEPRDTPGWSETSFFGASLAAMSRLANSKAYSLVHLELSGANAFFVRDDLVWAPVHPPTVRGPNYDLQGHHHAPADESRSYIDPGI